MADVTGDCVVCGASTWKRKVRHQRTPTCDNVCAARFGILRRNNMLYVLGDEVAEEWGGDPNE